MKKIYFISLFIQLVAVVYSQPVCDFKGKDSLFILIAGDTIQVWDIAACGYCNSSFVQSVNKSADTIYIVQTDTVSNVTLCGCIFNLRTSIVGLPSGTYQVMLYRDWPKNKIHKFIRAIQFSYTPISSQPLKWNGYQSGCVNDAVADEIQNIPKNYALFPNYPNPFNPSTTIEYEIGQTENVTISVYDVLGKEVSTLVSTTMPAGVHTLKFTMADAQSSGIYYCRMSAGTFNQTIMMILER